MKISTRKNKGQASTQVFVYIMAAIIIGVIVLVGYNGIGYLLKLQQQARIDTIFSDFISEVEITAKKYGSQVTYEFMGIPREYTQICFSDSRNEDGKFDGNQLTSPLLHDYPLIRASIENDVESNVFLMKLKNIEYAVEVPKLDVANDYDFGCIDTTQRISLVLKGSGRRTSIEIP